MLCYRGLGETASAEREETALPPLQGRRIRRSRSPQQPRLLSPEDNNERQPIHDHESVVLDAPLRCVAADAVAAAARRPIRRRPLHRRHRRRRHQVHPQRGPHGQEVAARDHGRGLRLLRRRWRRLARHPAGQRQGPGPRAAATPPPRSTATITTARSPTSRAAAASTSRSTAWASPSATTTTTAATTSTSPRSAATTCSTTKATASSATSPRQSGHRATPRFGTSAAWLDYDRDGKLDLFVANYVQWTPQNDLWCSLDGATKSYCTPESYKGTPSKLYHNLGGGKFEDVTAEGRASPIRPASRSASPCSTTTATAGPTSSSPTTRSPTSSIAICRTARSRRKALAAGVAFGEDGVARGAMGVDAADYDRSRPPAPARRQLLEPDARPLSQRRQRPVRRRGAALAVGRASLLTLTFGVFFFDYDLDGYPDIFAANGHIEEEIGARAAEGAVRAAAAAVPQPGQAASSSRVRPAFTPADGGARRGLRRLRPRRRSRRPDHHQQRPGVSVPQRRRQSQPLAAAPAAAATKSNRDGIGAVVRDRAADRRSVHSGSSYCSSSDLALTFGLGADAAPVTVEIAWPSGTRQKLANVKPDQHLTITGTMNEILTLSAVAQSKLIRDGEITSEELVRCTSTASRRSIRRSTRSSKCCPVTRTLLVFVLLGQRFHRNQRTSVHRRDARVPRPPACHGGRGAGRAAARGGRRADRAHQSPGPAVRVRNGQPDFRQDQQSIRLTRTTGRVERRRGGAHRGLRVAVRAGQRRRRQRPLARPFLRDRGAKPTSGRLPREGHVPPAGGWIESSGRSVRWPGMSKISMWFMRDARRSDIESLRIAWFRR